MIVVVGSRHDPVARALVDSWRGALCGAEDLVGPGWAWRVGGKPRIWRIEGATVDDRDVTGVFIRRRSVYAEELTSIHPEDRAYVAAEAHAFLSFVLGTTGARVCNPVLDGAFGEEALRFERWLGVAAAHGVATCAPRIVDSRRPSSRPSVSVEIVGTDVYGDAADRDKASALRVASALGLTWATFVFDKRHRLLGVTSTAVPSPAASNALGAWLGKTS